MCKNFPVRPRLLISGVVGSIRFTTEQIKDESNQTHDETIGVNSRVASLSWLSAKLDGQSWLPLSDK